MQVQAATGGSALRQTGPAAEPAGPQLSPSVSQSASNSERQVLVTFAEAGRQVFGGVSERKTQDLVKRLGIVPVILGPRCVRLVRSELEAAVANLPRRTQPNEPTQLLRARIERQKQTGVPA